MIDVFSIPDCQPCISLCAELSRRGIPYNKHMDDPDCPDNAGNQYPIVYIDGVRLSPRTTHEYVTIIEGETR